MRRDQRTCSSKIWYPSEELAQAELRRLESVGETGLRVYPCKFEEGRWHIGHIKWRENKEVQNAR